MKKLQAIPANEQAELLTNVEGETVHVKFTVKENGDKGKPRYNLIWHFDFAEVKIEELRKLATRSLRIDGQAAWRKAKDRMDADVWQGRKWSVRAMLNQTRQKANPVARAEKDAAKMSPAERKVHVATIMAMIKVDDATLAAAKENLSKMDEE